jgi:hypothetical protein
VAVYGIGTRNLPVYRLPVSPTSLFSTPRCPDALPLVPGVTLVSIKDAMGHSALATTGRYLHARPASEQAARFTRAFQPSLAEPNSATTIGALESV